MLDGMSSYTVLTWNLLGARRPELSRVAEVIRAAAPDAVALQEVQRAQAGTLATALGMRHHWAFKHVSLLARPEGGAVLTPHRLGGVEVVVLRRAMFWSWLRRIAVVATIERGADRHRFASVHLSPHDLGHSRTAEAGRLAAIAPDAVIAGDLNGLPGGAGPVDLVAAGWTDAWAAAHADDPGGATNWTGGARRGRPPTQRLDYVMAPSGWRVLRAEVVADPQRWDWFAALSDHLPVVAELEYRGSDDDIKVAR